MNGYFIHVKKYNKLKKIKKLIYKTQEQVIV